MEYSTAASHDAYIVFSDTGKWLDFHKVSQSSKNSVHEVWCPGPKEGRGLCSAPPLFQGEGLEWSDSMLLIHCPLEGRTLVWPSVFSLFPTEWDPLTLSYLTQ